MDGRFPFASQVPICECEIVSDTSLYHIHAYGYECYRFCGEHSKDNGINYDLHDKHYSRDRDATTAEDLEWFASTQALTILIVVLCIRPV